MSAFVWTPEDQARKLEGLVGDPEGLRERIESMLQSCLSMVEQDARYGAVVLRRIREKDLYRVAGWPTWAAFAEHWCPGGEERFDTLIRALEVLESRGDGRGFREAEAGQLAATAARRVRESAHDPATGDVLPGDGSIHPGNAAQFARHTQAERAAEKGVSRRTQQKLDAVAKRRPELLEEVKAGRMSAHRAAVAAGAAKDPSPLTQLRCWWGKATPDQKAAFAREFERELKGIIVTNSMPERNAA